MANELSQKFLRLGVAAAVAGCLSVCASGSVFAAETNAAKAPATAADSAPAAAKNASDVPPISEPGLNLNGDAATANSSADAPADEDVVNDPFETYNRHTFYFNDALDRNILQPVARFYNKIMPKPLNQGVHNFFLNLNTFSTIIDDFLQFNFYQMTNDSWRFVVNSTVGIGGLFDIATRINLKYYENDFGMTLATWGWKNSNYLVLPFYGSYTVRDGFSLPFDFFLFSAYQFIEPPKLRYGLYAVSVVDWRAQTMQYNELLDVASLDKYVFVRNAYLQRRAYQLDENRHLGLRDRNAEFAGTNPEDSPTGPGAAANVDESANVGQPANTETLQTATSMPGHRPQMVHAAPAAVSKS